MKALAKYKDQFPVFETEQLILRRISSADRDVLFSIFSDPKVMQYYNIFPITELGQADELIQKLENYFSSEKGIRWAIVLKANQSLIGTIGIFDRNENPYNAEIGFEISRNFWGKGLTAEAIRPVIQFGFNSLGLERIEARVVNGNSASQRVLEKCSFGYEGLQRKKEYWKNELQDLHFYSIFKNDIQSS